MTYAYDASDNRTGVQDSKGGLATKTFALANYPNLIRRRTSPGDGFGRIVTDTTGANGDGFKYTGREWDATAQLQYNRARYYDPAIGRWISIDPLGFAAGDANLYRYVGNGAVNGV